MKDENLEMAPTMSIEVSTTPDPEIGRPLLQVNGLRKVYSGRKGGAAHEAIADVSFDVTYGEFVCVVGPSGAGKTTLLKCLAGLQPTTEGTVAFRGHELKGVPEGLGVVFQDYGRSLFPWFTVAHNIEIPLQAARIKRSQRVAEVAHVLESVGLPDAGDRYPWQLSGGMQQRVALARALARGPSLLVMDEPFASVDAQSRFSLEDLVLKLRAEYDMTVVLVTHDIDEAIYLGDQVVVLSGSPSRVREVIPVAFDKPRSQSETRSSPEFGLLRRRVLDLLT